MIKWKWWDSFQEKRVIRRLRKELTRWGVDTRNLSDEKIKESMIRLSEGAARTGVSLEELANAMRKFAAIFKRLEGKLKKNLTNAP